MPFTLQATPIRRRKVHQEVAERIEDLIRSGAVAQGEVLPPERELMRVFGVGRPAVREAMLSLERSGLVVLSNGERARVARPTAERMLEGLSSAARLMIADTEGMKHFQAARRVFETALAREAASTASDGDIAALRAALDRNVAAVSDVHLFEQTDVEFHLEIIRIARNPILLALHRALSQWLVDQRRTSLQSKGACADAVVSHRRLYDAIAARDPDAAEKAMRAHLESVNTYYWAQANASAEPAAAGAAVPRRAKVATRKTGRGSSRSRR